MKTYTEIEYRTNKFGYCNIPEEIKKVLSKGKYIIVEIESGIDIVKVNYLDTEIKDINNFDYHKLVNFVRVAHKKDLEILSDLLNEEKEANLKFKKILQKYKLPMKLFRSVYQFDKKKIIFYFTADIRIDFRDFVKELAKIFKTRIELIQITGRDQSKELGGIGKCGYQYCCYKHLKKFSQITVKMIKNQNLSRNLSKLSGPCGRLLCCLDYEDNFYSETSKDFPSIGETVVWNGKEMIVDKNDLYNNKIYLTIENSAIEIITLEEYKKIKK